MTTETEDAALVREIADLLRAARAPGAAHDPSFFLQKAATLEKMAAVDEHRAPELRAMAARARELAAAAPGGTKEANGGG